MANPTSNFNWQMPTNTDLVKDLPADFEVFGQAVDTSLADLKGGTSGQILSKNSNTDMDFVWINNDQGDITAVTAGTGLTGGGSSGAVTLTNDMATTITAAGDLIVGTGSGTYDNLPIGTTNQVLTADTSVSPYKVKWASVATTTQKISQVVVSNLLSTATTTSTSFVDTGLSVTITPSSATSTILIHATVPLGMANAASGVFLTLANGAGTNLLNPTSPGSRTPSYTRMEGADQYSMRSTSIVFEHSPASTSAQTYKIQFKVTGSTGCVNRMGTDSNAADYSQGISTIVAYEVTA